MQKMPIRPADAAGFHPDQHLAGRGSGDRYVGRADVVDGNETGGLQACVLLSLADHCARTESIQELTCLQERRSESRLLFDRKSGNQIGAAAFLFPQGRTKPHRTRRRLLG